MATATATAEAEKAQTTRPYVVLRRVEILAGDANPAGGLTQLRAGLTQLGVKGDLWVEVGLFTASRAEDAMKAAGAQEHKDPKENVNANYRAFPAGNDSRLALSLEVKPVFTWE